MEHLDTTLSRLVADGTLTRPQAEAVRNGVADAARRSGISPLVEALGYLGAVLAITAGLTIASAFWSDLALWSQAGVLGLVAAGLVAAGQVTRSNPAPAAGRLAGFCWLLAVPAFAGMAAVLAEPLSRPDLFEDLLIVVVSGPTLLLSAVLWMLRRGALQLLPVIGAVIGTVLGVLELAQTPPYDLYGVVVWAIGTAVVALGATDVVAPPRAAAVLGSIAALVGAQVSVFSLDSAVSLGLLVTALGVLAVGTWVLHDRALLGLGAAATAVAVPQVLNVVAPGAIGGPGLVLVTGIGLLAAALVALRNRSSHTHDAQIASSGPIRPPDGTPAGRHAAAESTTEDRP